MSDFGRMADRIDRMQQRLPDSHSEATEDAMDDLARAVRIQLLGNYSLARHVLIADIHNDAEAGSATVNRSVNAPEWAKYLEHGTGSRGQGGGIWSVGTSYPAPSPGPPLDNIRTWIIAKNIQSLEYGNATQLAGAIQDTIGDVGTYAHPFMRPAWFGPQGYRHIVNENARALRRELVRL